MPKSEVPDIPKRVPPPPAPPIVKSDNMRIAEYIMKELRELLPCKHECGEKEIHMSCNYQKEIHMSCNYQTRKKCNKKERI